MAKHTDIFEVFEKDGIFVYGWYGAICDQYVIIAKKEDKIIYNETWRHFKHSIIIEEINSLKEKYDLQVYDAAKYWWSVFSGKWYFHEKSYFEELEGIKIVWDNPDLKE